MSGAVGSTATAERAARVDSDAGAEASAPASSSGAEAIGAASDAPLDEAVDEAVASPEETPCVRPRVHVAIVIACVLIVIGAHAVTLGYVKFANVDESYAVAIAKRLLDGHRLYDTAISQRGPLMYYSFALIAKCFGWDNILAIRGCALALSLAHVLLVYWAARRLLSKDAALVAASIVAYALGLGFTPDDGLAINGETLLIPMLLVGVATGGIAMRAAPGSRARRRGLAVAGLALGAAMCTKQTTVPQVLPLGVWLVAEAYARGARRTLVGDAAALAAGWMTLPIVFVWNAWRHGTLRALVYYTYSYNVAVHTRPFHREPLFVRWIEHAPELPLFFGAVAAVLAIVLARWAPRARRFVRFHAPDALLGDFELRDYLMAQAIVALAVAAAVPQLFPHYFLVPLPLMALVLAQALTQVVEGGRARRAFELLLIACASVWTVTTAGLAYFREKADGRVTHDASPEQAAKYIQSITSPDDKIFVWGFSPWLYGYSHRAPAGRYVFATYVTGFIPWFWDGLPDEWKNVVPGSMEALLGDLDRESPAVVVDAGSVSIARSMRAYPEAAAWLHAHYCFDARVGPFDMYKRKRAGSSCFTTYFPYPAPNVDYFGRPLPVLSPMAVDFPDSAPLPPGDYTKPIRFTPPNVCGGEQPWSPMRPHPEQTACDFGFDRQRDLEDPLRPMCSYPCPLPEPPR